METSSLSPANRAAQTAGVVRQLLGIWLLLGLFWYVVVLFVELPSLVEFLLLFSTVPLGGVAVFMWRAYPTYKEAIQ